MFNEYGGGYWLQIDAPLQGFEDDRKLLEPKEFIGKWNDIVVHARWTKKDDSLAQSLDKWRREDLL